MKRSLGKPVVVNPAALDATEEKLLADHGLLDSVEDKEATLIRCPIEEDPASESRPWGPDNFVGRTLDRLQAVQVLFQAEGAHRSAAAILDGDYLVIDVDDAEGAGRESFVTNGPIREWARELAIGTDERRAEIDEVLGRVSTGWDVSRMSPMDRNILRLALYELIYLRDASPAVIGNEAVVLAKTLGTDDSHVFVNGIVGAVGREIASADATGVADAEAVDESAADEAETEAVDDVEADVSVEVETEGDVGEDA